MLLQVLLVRSVQDVVLLIRHEAVIGEIPVIFARLLSLDLLLSRGGRRLGGLVNASHGRLLLKLGEDHLAGGLAIFSLGRLDILNRGLGLDLLDGGLGFDLGLRLGLGLDHSDADVAPEAVTELIAGGGGQTPVRDDLARAGGGAEQHREWELLARSQRSIADGRLGSGDELRDAGGMVGVDMSHVVTTDKLDRAAGGPGSLALVSEDPGLLKDVVGREDSAIDDSVGHKDGAQGGGLLNRGGSGSLLLLLDLLLLGN